MALMLRGTSTQSSGKILRAVLIIGTSAKRPNIAYQKLKLWERITEEYVLKIHSPKGPYAVQFVFSSRDGRA